MPYSPAELLDEITARFDKRPWGFMQELSAPEANLTVKYLFVGGGERTSLQVHEHKDELMFLLNGEGFVEVDGVRSCYVHDTASSCLVRVRPGAVHRVTGHLEYMEISSYDAGTDTIRLEDDYDRS